MRFPCLFYKAGPAEHIVKFVNGDKRREGKGLFCIVGPRTTLVSVPVTDQSISWNFTELTNDRQQVVVQGELSVRYIPDELISRRDFTIDPSSGAYESEDPESVYEEISHLLQSFVRGKVEKLALRESLAATADIERDVLAAVKSASGAFRELGVEIKNLFVTDVTPANPDLKKALEAEEREKMLSAADRALAERRKSAAENDRVLKEYEAETAQRLEAERAKLIEERNKNLSAEAAADADAVAKRLAPYANVAPGLVLALGIREIAASGRIGQFNFTPDVLAAINAAVKNGVPAKE